MIVFYRVYFQFQVRNIMRDLFNWPVLSYTKTLILSYFTLFGVFY